MALNYPRGSEVTPRLILISDGPSGLESETVSAIETILAIEGMQRGLLLPTINHTPDPDLSMDVVAEGIRPQDQTFVLKNAFGFGGCNSCVVLQRQG